MQLFSVKIMVLIGMAGLLQACGSERDTPFNPGGSSSSSAASVGATIPMTQIYQYDEQNPEQPDFLETTQKQIIVMRDEDEFAYFWDAYHESTTPFSVDFEKEQVVLLDLGNIGNCTEAINYRNYKANEYSNDAVLVSFNYRNSNSNASASSSSSSSGSSSSCPDLHEKRPFYFYKVETRKKILIEENMTFGTL